MKKSFNKYIDICFLFIILFISFFIMECLFKLFAFQDLLNLSTLRIFLFTFVFSLATALLLSFFNFKIQRVLLLSIIFVFATYIIAQLGFKAFMGNYMSIAATGDGAGRIQDYIIPFIRYIPMKTYLIYLPFFVCFFLFLFHKITWAKQKRTLFFCFSFLVAILCLHGISLLTLTAFKKDTDLIDLNKLYQRASFQELALQEFGAVRFLERDIVLLFQEGENEIILDSPAPILPSTKPELNDLTRKIDDHAWNLLKESEEGKTLKSIDSYLQAKVIPDRNKMSGTFENKNFILIMVEAFDYIGVDETLTPTLYKMMQGGIQFKNHYTPKFSCTTGESEFISQTSLVPSSNICTPNEYANNTFSQSIFELFNQKGYTSSSYHNWTDQFYDRHTLHKNMGSFQFLDVDELEIKKIQGWQSDKTLMEKALPHFVNQQPFFAYLITSSTHFPYDTSSTLGDRYLNRINEVYPDHPIEIKRYISKAMELDHALAYLIEQLEVQGIANNTVIAMFSDHHPLNTPYSKIIAATKQIDRNVGFNIDRTPFFIYNPQGESIPVDKVSSTFDILPTIANLFNLTFDPRFYVGIDIFSQEESLVIFTNGNWVNNQGYYQASKAKFTAFDKDFSYGSDEIAAINKKVNDQFTISNLIYKSNYFKTRNFKIRYLP